MGNEMFQARVPDDFAEKIHEYKDENHMSKSEAVRHLLRRGLAAEGHSVDDSDSNDDDGPDTKTFFERLASGSTVSIGTFFAIIALLTVSTGFLSPIPGTAAAVVGAIFLGLAGLTFWTIVIAHIALARPLPVIGTIGEESETA